MSDPGQCHDAYASDFEEVVSFKLSDVPEYLRQTQFFVSLEYDDEEITLPKHFYKTNLDVLSSSDARDLLSTMRFWGVDKIPFQLIMFVAKSSHQDLCDMLSDFAQELKIVEFLRLLNSELYHIRPSTYDKYVDMSKLSRKGTTMESVVSLLGTQFQHERGQIWNARTCALAASTGWLDCLIFLHDMGCPWDASTNTNAAKYNHPSCLRYAHTRGCPWDAEIKRLALKGKKTQCYKYARKEAGLLDTSACTRAAKTNNLPLLKSSYESGCAWDKRTCAAAAAVGLQYAHEQGCPWDASACSSAAQGDHLECLAYAHEKGCPWDESTCRKAAERGQLACLMYAHQEGCPWNQTTCEAAASKSSAACLMYAHKQGCPWGSKVIERAALFGKVKCLRYALEKGCPGREIACQSVHDRVKCLKYLHEEQNCPWDTRIADKFAGSLFSSKKCLAYCLEQGCKVDSETMLRAAHHRSRMKLIRAHGCPWDARTLHEAARTGKLRCVQFCVENGCPGREDVALVAAPFLPLLQFLYAQSCPLPPEVYERALRAERPIECVRFLYETGVCPWPQQACTWFVQHRRMDCLVYAHTHGAPWDADTCAAAVNTRTNMFHNESAYSEEEEHRRALHFLCYLHEKGCAWDARTVWTAKSCANELCAQYALQHGCPQPVARSTKVVNKPINVKKKERCNKWTHRKRVRGEARNKRITSQMEVQLY